MEYIFGEPFRLLLKNNQYNALLSRFFFIVLSDRMNKPDGERHAYSQQLQSHTSAK